MTKSLKFATIILSTLTLGACVSREQADDKLIAGCKVGAQAFLEEGYEIKAINNTDATDDNGYRKITLSAIESDGWDSAERTYICIFQEDFAAFKSDHNATIYQLDMSDGRIYGMKDGTLLGTMEEHEKLVLSVEEAIQ